MKRLLLVWLAFSGLVHGADTPPRPNVLFIALDDLNRISK
jgi:hypothetical protein